MQRSLARHQNEPASFLQMHVGRTNQKIVGHAAGDRRQRPHGARRHDHARGRKRPAGNRRADVCVVVGSGGLLQQARKPVRANLVRKRAVCRRR
ncbi:hypothetical protein BBX50_20965 [Ensifer sp. LC11]|nr:hypothetical protein BBX50_20965 [Ensifer sp. LC11]